MDGLGRFEKITFASFCAFIFPVSILYLLIKRRIGWVRAFFSIMSFIIMVLWIFNNFRNLFNFDFLNMEQLFWIILVSSGLSSQQNLMFLDECTSSVGEGVIHNKMKKCLLLMIYFYMYLSLLFVSFLFYAYSGGNVVINVNNFFHFLQNHYTDFIILVVLYFFGLILYVNDERLKGLDSTKARRLG